MEPQYPEPDLVALTAALSDLRNLWVQLSMILKDHITEVPSPKRDEVVIQVERHLARIREGERGAFK
jgi:hypothetical protein